MADETAVIDAGAAVDTSAAVDTTQTATDTQAVTTTPVVDTPAIDPNDPMAALEAAMNGLLPADEAEEAKKAAAEGQNVAVPEQFQQALEISDFVKSPESVQQAVRAADEVWKVATGQVPARQMLEGFKAANPQQYQAIVQDLASYIGEVTGQQFGAQAQPSPLDGLKQANPEAYAEIAKYFESITGKPMDGPADPRDARMTAIEERIAREDQERQQAVFNQQARAADAKVNEFLGSKLKGTFGEGQEPHFINLIAQKLGPEGVRVSMEEVLKGNTSSIEKAYKAIVKDETTRLKAYNANLVKQYRTLGSAVPAVKGSAQAPDAKSTAKLPGESTAQHAARLWKEGLV